MILNVYNVDCLYALLKIDLLSNSIYLQFYLNESLNLLIISDI